VKGVLEAHRERWALNQEIRLYSEVVVSVKKKALVISKVTIVGEQTLWAEQE
jgi:hypothetical protein